MIKPESIIYADFPTYNPTTGASADADSLPTGTLVRNGTDTAVTVTVSKKETGIYKAIATVPAEYVAGDKLAIRIAATVSSVAAKAVVWEDFVDSKLVDDLNDPTAEQCKATGFAVAGDAMTLTTEARNTLAAAVEAELINDASSLEFRQELANKINESLDINELNLAAIAEAVWSVLTASLTTSNSIGKRIVDNLDATVSSRNATAPDNTAINDIYNLIKVTGDGDVSAMKTILDTINGLIEDNGGDRFTAKALETAPSGTGGITESAMHTILDNYVAAGGTFDSLELAGKVLTNKAAQNKTTGVITYYDDDGTTPILTITPTDDGSVLTRTPS